MFDTTLPPNAYLERIADTETPLWSAPQPPVVRQPRVGHVLHVINGEHYSGAERVQDLLGKCLPQFGYEIAYVCLKAGKFSEARAASTAPIVELPMRHRADLSQISRMVKLIRQHKFDIVHAHSPRSAMMAAAAAAWANVPFVYHVHSPTSRDSTHRLRNWINQCVETRCMARASHLVCVSHSLAAHLRGQGIRDDRLTVVHNGVPQVAEVPPRATPRGTWTLGTVALFRPRKGLEILLQALAHLRSQGHQVRLRAIGPFETVEYQRSIQHLATELKLQEAIDWIGFTRDVNLQFTQMDLFVLPSLFGEGLPMVVLEAMAAGTPLVATDVEGVTEAIVDGQSGMIARPGDAAHLAEQIEQVLSGKTNWQSLRATALERHAESFSDIAMAHGVATLYDQILQKTRPAAEPVTKGVTPDIHDRASSQASR